MSEHIDYRNNLEQILQFTGGTHMLTIADVSRFTGIKKYYVLKKRYPFIDNYISAATLARCMCGSTQK